MDRTDEQGVRSDTITYVDRQVGQPIVSLGHINTFRPLNLVIAISMWRDF